MKYGDLAIAHQKLRISIEELQNENVNHFWCLI